MVGECYRETEHKPGYICVPAAVRVASYTKTTCWISVKLSGFIEYEAETCEDDDRGSDTQSTDPRVSSGLR